jgi:hypothetical protein
MICPQRLGKVQFGHVLQTTGQWCLSPRQHALTAASERGMFHPLRPNAVSAAPLLDDSFAYDGWVFHRTGTTCLPGPKATPAIVLESVSRPHI